MIIPFVGATYQMEAVSFDNQRCKNLYPIISESGTSKSPSALRSVSGLKEFVAIGSGGIRGGIESADRAFFVSGNEFYEVTIGGVATLRGTLDTVTGICSLEENPTQIIIIDGVYGYIFDRVTNVFTKISDVNFPTPSSLSFQDGYFIVTKSSSGSFYISNINNGLVWGALDFTTVESSPDNLVCVKSDSSNLWLFGTKSTEIYFNSGAAAFPFSKRIGASIETGCAAQKTVQELDNTIYWLGTDENGDSVVWKAAGYNAVRVSTQAIERKIADSTNFAESYSWVYHERGHAFYCLQIKGLKTTLVLDVATGLWHERVYRNPTTGLEEQHRGLCHIFFRQKHFVGDRETNQIYEMSLKYYDDAGAPLVKERISPHYDEVKSLITHAQFELDMEIGIGDQAGQGSSPQVMMKYSDNGGRTWSNELWRDIGKAGEYKTRVRWHKLGRSRDRVYLISISDPVLVQINEATLNDN